MAKKKATKTAKARTKKTAEDVSDTAHRVWLAGLGALASAEEKGSQWFKALIEKGEDLQNKGKDQLKDQVDKAKDAAEKAWDGVTGSVDERVTTAMHKLGVPTRDEIRSLTERVEELTAKIDAMSAKPAAKKTAPRKTAARKAPARKAAPKTTKKAAAKA